MIYYILLTASKIYNKFSLIMRKLIFFKYALLEIIKLIIFLTNEINK